MRNLAVIAVMMLFPFAASHAQTVTLCVPKSRSELLEIVAVIARENGFFTKHGLKIDIRQIERVGITRWVIQDGKIIQPRLLDNRVANLVQDSDSGCDTGVSTVERLLAAEFRRSAIRPLFVSSFGEFYDTHILTGINSKIKNVKELRGKTVRLGQLPTYVAMLGALEANNMTLNDVKVIYGFAGNEKIDSLNDGRLDATTAYLPSMAFHLISGQVKILEPNIVSKYVGKRIPHSLLVVNEEYLRKNPKTVAAFRAAIHEGYEYLIRNRREIFSAYVKSAKQRRENWLLSKSPAELEKAAAFIGPFPFIDLTENNAATTEAFCDMKRWGNILIKRGFIDSMTDLAPWLGIKPEQAATCETTPLAMATKPN